MIFGHDLDFLEVKLIFEFLKGAQYIIFLDTETYPLDKEESIESKWKFVVMDLWFICLQNK